MRCLSACFLFLLTGLPLLAQLSWVDRSGEGIGGGATNLPSAGVAYGGGRFVLANSTQSVGVLAWSEDGLAWNNVTSTAGVGGNLFDVAYGADRFVAVGATGGTNAVVATSTNGASWNQLTGTAAAPIGGALHAVAWNGSQFVAAGTVANSAVVFATSSDGQAWQDRSGGGNAMGGVIYDLAYGHGRWIAVGWNGVNAAVIATSTDGTTWENVSVEAAIGGRLKGIAFDGSRFVAVGYRTSSGGSTTATVFSSADGRSWTDHSGDLGLGGRLHAIRHANGRFVGVGGNTAQTFFIESTSATSWAGAAQFPGFSPDAFAVSWGEDTWVATGSNSAGVPIFVAADSGGGGPALVTLLDDVREVSSAAQTSFVGFTTDPAGGAWTAGSDVAWITPAATAGTGGTNLSLQIAENSGAAERAGRVTINGAVFTLVQRGVGQPAVPGSLRVAHDGATEQVRVSWNSVFGATGYRVQRSLDGGGSWSDLGTTGTVFPYELFDDTAPGGRAVSYRVRAETASGASAWSEAVSLVTPPALPGDFAARALSSSQIELSWSDTEGETGYRIEREEDGFFTTVADLPANTTSWRHAGLSPETLHTYRLAVDAEGAFGRVAGSASATTPASSDSILWRGVESELLDLHSVAHGNDRWVAVGTGGVMMTSADRLNWSKVEGSGADLHAVAFADGRFLAVGARGTVLRSSDGVRWAPVPIGAAVDLIDLTHVGGEWVALSAAAAWTSSDGASWAPLSLPAGTSWVSVDAATVGLVLIAADGAIHAAPGVGDTWTLARTGPPAEAESPFFWTRTDAAPGGGMDLAVGPAGRWSTHPGDNVWTDREDGSFAYLEAVTYGAGQFVGVGINGRPRSTTDGTFWIESAYENPGITLLDVASDGQTFVAVGTRGIIVQSPDGRSWTEARPPEGTAQALRAVAADGAGAVVAVGDDVVLHRPGAGADWVERTVPNNAPFGYQLQDVTWTGTQWVAVGSGNMVSASPDGVTWTTLSEGDHVTDDYWAVAAGRGRLVTGGGSTTLIHSDDGGSSFTPAAYAGRSNFQAPAELLFEDGFVALASVFSDTQMYASDDGETWESARTLRGDPEYISRLAALPLDGGPVYLAAGYFAGLNRGGAFLGTERRNWEGGPFAFSTGDLAGLAAGGGIFLAVSDRGELQASLNGRHWEPAPDGFVSQAIAESGFTDLVHDGEAFIGVTLSGRIVRLAVAARSALPESARFHLEAVWQAGALHLRWTADDARLVTSSDLAPGSWTEVEGATSPWPIYAMPVRPAFYRLEGDGVEPDGAAP